MGMMIARSASVPGKILIVPSAFGAPGREPLRLEIHAVADRTEHTRHGAVMPAVQDGEQVAVIFDCVVELVDE